MKLKPKYWMPAGTTIALVGAIELGLRLLGFGDPALLQADRDAGYIFAPNQIVYRFGNRIEYNQFSQRSEPIVDRKPEGTLRILMTGDSVLNGNNTTDQKETISELLEARLAGVKPRVEVLNVSAGSWGIGNQLGYIRKFGTFDSDAVILQIGTHDLLQPPGSSSRVGNDPLMPNRKPLLAVQEVFERHFWPQVSSFFESHSAAAAMPVSEAERFGQNMQKLEEIAALVRAKNIPLFVLYTPDRADLLPQPNRPKFKAEFFARLKVLQIEVIDIHEGWSKLQARRIESYFRDGVHPTPQAYESIADLMFQELCGEKKLAACGGKK
ncbi:MAG: SGNH/GDSL hydrolase family protein [Richelia sp. CSU_2_1]|nr:SGNH/GDSL hydrolase family protein [Richelia sp. CSU_2_1]